MAHDGLHVGLLIAGSLAGKQNLPFKSTHKLKLSWNDGNPECHENKLGCKPGNALI